MKGIATLLALFISSIAMGQGLNRHNLSHPGDVSNRDFHTENTEIGTGSVIEKGLAESTISEAFSFTKDLLSNSDRNLHSEGNEGGFSGVSSPLICLFKLSPGYLYVLDSLPDSGAQASIDDSLDFAQKQVAFNIYAIPDEEEIMIEGVSYMAELTVYDLKGKRHEPTPSYPYQQGMRLNIHQLQSGIYVLHIKDEQLNKMMKLVKK